MRAVRTVVFVLLLAVFAMSAPAFAADQEVVDDFDTVNVDGIDSAFKAAVGDRYGGTFIDRSVSPPVLRELSVDPSPADAQTLDQISGSDPRVQLGSARYSRAVLEHVSNAIETEFEADTGSDEWSVGVDDERQAVVVSASQLDATLRARLSALGPPEAVEFDITPDYSFADTNSCRMCYPAYEAGLGMAVAPSSLCTSGFTLRAPSSTLRAADRRRRPRQPDR
jgi:hypothetical protein